MRLNVSFNFNMYILFLETDVKPAVLEEFNNLKDLLETNLTNFKNYRDRLKIVRNKSSTSQKNENIPYCHRDYDLYSDVGSTIGSSTGSRWLNYLCFYIIIL